MELLEILLVYWKDFEASVSDIQTLLDKFKVVFVSLLEYFLHKYIISGISIGLGKNL